MQRFGEKLRSLRKQHGMTIKDLARVTGYATHSHISEMETGKKKPLLEFAVKVADLFNVSIDQLVRDELDIE